MTETNTLNSVLNRIAVIQSILEQGDLKLALSVTKRVRKEIEEIQDKLELKRMEARLNEIDKELKYQDLENHAARLERKYQDMIATSVRKALSEGSWEL